MVVAAVYLRQSLDRSGEAVAVARQREDCIALCADKGWAPREFTDNDTSASSGKRRPGYEAMLQAVADGQVGAVVAWDLDRLHRRPVELEAFIDIADKHRLLLATVSGDVDLSTAQGRLVARLKGNVARHEIEHKSARQKRATLQKAQRGEPNWSRAFGYLPDVWQPDPATAPLVAEAYRAIIAGASLKDVAELFNSHGAYGLNGKPWSLSVVSYFLRSPRNAGLRVHNREIVGPGTWPALVNEGTWRSAQSVLNTPGRAPGRKSVRRHLLTGMLQCGVPGCGGYLSGQWVAQRGTVPKAITYACKDCHRCSVRADHIEPLLHKLVTGRLAKPDAVDLLKTEQHDVAEAEALRAERLTLLARLDEIADERADGLLTGQQAARATERVTAKLADIDARQCDQERLRVFDGIPLGTPQVVSAVAGLSPDRYRAILDVLMIVTVLSLGRTGNKFNPERVQVKWR